MKSKLIKIYILGSVLLVAVVVLLMPSDTEKNGHSMNDNKTFGFEINEIDKIEIGSPGQTETGRHEVKLVKVDSQWLVASNHNYKAMQAGVKILLEKVQDITQGELVSQNVDKQKLLEIDSEGGVQVKIYKNQEVVANFWIGKIGADGNSTFFRLDGSEKVYITKNSIRPYFVQREWVDKVVLTLDKEKINKIVVNNEWQKTTIEKKTAEKPAEGSEVQSDIWNVILPWKFEASQQKVDGILDTVSNLQAENIVFEKTLEQTGLIKSKSSIVVYQEGEKDSVEIVIGKKLEEVQNTPESFYVKLAESDQIFTLNSYMVENILLPKTTDLKKRDIK